MKNLKVVIYSLMALLFIVLAFLVDWLFLIPAILLSILSQRELTKQQKNMGAP